MKLLVTGGCGFIGSNFVRFVLEAAVDVEITVLDLLTYAGNLENLGDLLEDPRLTFVPGDIADPAIVDQAARGSWAVVNFAAESHVDRSLHDAAPFIRTNIVGTHVLLDAVRSLGISRFVQISTDEVYGSIEWPHRFSEDARLAPSNPYSASKAGADLLVLAHARTWGVPTIIARASNAYGPNQHPEKLIPLMISRALAGEPLPVYGDGLHVRSWIHVHDLCSAIWSVLQQGQLGEVYNVGGCGERPNLEVVKKILDLTGAPASLIRHVSDRLTHDRRYAMDTSKVFSSLGWNPQVEFDSGLTDTVSWYINHPEWVKSILSGEYDEYYQRQYAARLAASTPRPPRGVGP